MTHELAVFKFYTMKKDRDQINFVVDADVRLAIDEIRAMSRPIPTISQVLRDAVLEKRDRLRKKIADQEGKKAG